MSVPTFTAFPANLPKVKQLAYDTEKFIITGLFAVREITEPSVIAILMGGVNRSAKGRLYLRGGTSVLFGNGRIDVLCDHGVRVLMLHRYSMSNESVPVKMARNADVH